MRKKIPYVLKKNIYISIILMYSLISFSIIDQIDINFKIIGWIGWGLFILSIVSWIRIGKSFISPYIFFLIVSYLFLFGQSLLIPFDLVSSERNLLNLKLVNEYSLYKAQIYTLMCLMFFHIGALMTSKEEKKIYIDELYIEKRNIEIIYKSIRYVGITILIVSFIPYFIQIYKSINMVSSYGYKGLYLNKESITGFNSIVKNISKFYIPSLICLLIGYKDNIKARITILIVSIISIMLILYTGERNDAVIFALIIVLIYHYFIKKITFKSAYKYIILGLLAMSLLSSIADVRGMSNRGFFDYIRYMIENGFNLDAITEILSELGWTMFPTVAIMDLVPSSEPFRYGSTYTYSFLSIIPNLGIWDIHPAAAVASLSPWLQQKLSMSYGPGFSLVAESYLNFGWCGGLVFIFLGSFFEKILSLYNKYNSVYYPEICCCTLIFLNSSLFTIRDTFLGSIRAIFYMALPVYLLIRIINKRYNNIIRR